MNTTGSSAHSGNPTAGSTEISPNRGSRSEFHIRQFKPATVPTPLHSIKFTSDSDTVLLDPNMKDATFMPELNYAGTSVEDLYQGGTTGHDLTAADMEDKIRIQLAGARRKLFFDPQKTSVGIVTCGGVCPGLNNVIRALVNILYYRYGVERIIGYKYGFQGLVAGKSKSVALTPDFVKDIHLFGGTILGTSRGPQDPHQMVDFLTDQRIDILFCIGGDGTQKGAHSLVLEIDKRPQCQISVIGIGKTIDNDLLFVDRSFGFETAIQLSQQAIVAAHEEARSAFNGIGIVKLMGRESGAIALNASIANGDVNILLVPEVKFTIEKLVDYLAKRFETRDHCLIVCAEGAGQDLLPDTGRKDASGNRIFGDIGEFLKTQIGTELKKRKIEHSIKYIDPSYTIRGGACNASDAVLCTLYAQMAAHSGMAGKTDMMVGLLHGQFVHLPLTKVTQGRKNIDIRGMYWQAFLDATGSPFDQ